MARLRRSQEQFRKVTVMIAKILEESSRIESFAAFKKFRAKYLPMWKKRKANASEISSLDKYISAMENLEGKIRGYHPGFIVYVEKEPSMDKYSENIIGWFILGGIRGTEEMVDRLVLLYTMHDSGRIRLFDHLPMGVFYAKKIGEAETAKKIKEVETFMKKLALERTISDVFNVMANRRKK